MSFETSPKIQCLLALVNRAQNQSSNQIQLLRQSIQKMVGDPEKVSDELLAKHKTEWKRTAETMCELVAKIRTLQQNGKSHILVLENAQHKTQVDMLDEMLQRVGSS